MKGDNPPRQYVPLYCNPPTQAQIDSEAELYSFPPIREWNRTPHAPPISAHSLAARQTMSDSEAELSDFPPIKERNSTPSAPPIPVYSHLPRPQTARRSSRQLPLSSEEESPQSRRCRQPNMGLGQNNIVNTVNAVAPVQQAKVTPHTLCK